MISQLNLYFILVVSSHRNKSDVIINLKCEVLCKGLRLLVRGRDHRLGDLVCLVTNIKGLGASVSYCSVSEGGDKAVLSRDSCIIV